MKKKILARRVCAATLMAAVCQSIPAQPFAVDHDHQLWPGGVMEFRLLGDVRTGDAFKLLDALNAYSSAGVRAVHSQDCEVNCLTVNISDYGYSCYSDAGLRQGGSTMGLARTCFDSPGTLRHEAAHAWGLIHSTSSPDRCEWMDAVHYNEMYVGAVRPYEIKNITAIPLPSLTGLEMSRSITGYGRYTLSRTGEAVYSVLQGMEAPPGTRGHTEVSKADIAWISAIYAAGRDANTTILDSPHLPSVTAKLVGDNLVVSTSNFFATMSWSGGTIECGAEYTWVDINELSGWRWTGSGWMFEVPMAIATAWAESGKFLHFSTIFGDTPESLYVRDGEFGVLRVIANE